MANANAATAAVQATAPNTTTVTITAPQAPAVPPPSSTQTQVVVEQPAIEATGSSLNIYGFRLDWMVVALIVSLLAVIVILYRVQRNPDNRFDLLDLLMDNGRLSRVAFAFIGSFAVTNWVIVTLTLNGKLTEGYLTIYVAAWVAPLVTRILKGSVATDLPDQGGQQPKKP